MSISITSDLNLIRRELKTFESAARTAGVFAYRYNDALAQPDANIQASAKEALELANFDADVALGRVLSAVRASLSKYVHDDARERLRNGRQSACAFRAK